jgi:aconitate hydratase
VDQLDGQTKPIPQVARHYTVQGLGWVVIGDENYGEGSSREHAAMSPRLLGCKLVIANSFARLHITNLKRQGILPATFANPADHDNVLVDDRLSTQDLAALTPGKPLTATLHHRDGKTESIILHHSMTEEQIRWFRAGAALNSFTTNLHAPKIER